MQKLRDYIDKNYLDLEYFCKTERVETNVQKCVKCHKDSFYSKSRAKYECHNFRRLHVIRYIPSRVKPTSDLIGAHIISGIKSRTNLSVAAFGGGPGTEALALMNQLSKNDGKYCLRFDNIDLEASWKPIYEDLIQRFAEWVENIEINPRFFQGDITGSIKAPYYDIVFVSWLLSLIDAKDRLTVLEKARDLARSGGHIVVTDRTEQDKVEEISGLISSTKGWNLVKHDCMLETYCGVAVPEEARKIFWIELNSNTAYWVLKKA